ncbi:hypothetical protein HDU80_001153 [Chytriomyces hyalinus]|nr:hypothetical protein HDU80_001153 [Chytriomyces hyalinus]
MHPGPYPQPADPGDVQLWEAHLRCYYSNGITDDAKTQWQTLWESITITDDNMSFEISKSINDLVDLVDEHQSIYGTEDCNEDLLTYLISVHLKIDTEGAREFCPPLVLATLPEDAEAPVNNTLVRGESHYSLGITNFMNLLHWAAEESAKQATAATTAVTTMKPKTNATKGSKTCSHHEKGQAKVAKAKVAKSKNCGLCKKKHALKDCPNIKPVLKLVAKSAEESDNESEASETPALLAKPTKGKATANGAVAVTGPTKTIHGQVLTNFVGTLASKSNNRM